MKVRQFIRILSFLPVLMISGHLHAQPYIIQGTIEHSGGGLIYLASYYGDRFSIADSVETSSGSFHFLLSEEDPAGIYRLIFADVTQGIRSENRFVEFIYNHEDVLLNVTIDKNGPVPGFENSVENQVYFEFMTFQLEYEASLTEVYRRLYPARPGDEAYISAVTRYGELQQRRNSFMDSLTLLYPGLYATRIMNAFRAPVVLGTMSHRERIDTLKQHFFDVASIDDPGLLYAPVYTFRIVDYLSLFRVDSLSAEQQEEQFIEAVDLIMVNVAPLPELLSFVVEFMLEGFELLGMEQVQVYLADHYLDESCESEVAALVRSRMEGYKRMVVGATAPDFTARDIHGSQITLSALPNRYSVVVFWSGTCVHCREMIPDLQRWYSQENSMGVEVVSISIDKSASVFESYLAEQEMSWIVIRDPGGWYGKIAGDYHIYSTPSLFLLDRERKILARPVRFRQLMRALKKLN